MNRTYGDLAAWPVVEIPVADVYPDPAQPRVDMGDIDALADSIARVGQLDAILVRRDGDIHRIINGERRWRALGKLGREVVFAKVAETDDEEIALIELAANQHKELDATEVSRGLQRTFSLGVAATDSAAVTGLDAERLALAEKGYAIARPFYGDNEYEPTTIERFIAIAETDDESEREALLKVPEARVAALADDYRRARAVTAEIEELRDAIEAAGIEIVDSSSDHLTYAGQLTVKDFERPGFELPEGVIEARIVRMYTSAYASLYVEHDDDEADAAEVAARNAEQEAVVARRRTLQADGERVIAFIADRLRAPERFAGQHLHALAAHAWEAGVDASRSEFEVRKPLAAIDGDLARMHAAVLGAIAAVANRALIWGARRDDYLPRLFESPATLALYAALKAEGYEPSEVEAEALRELEGGEDE